MARAKGREYWAELVRLQEMSGQSVAAFCRERGLAANSLYHWRKQIGRTGEDMALVKSLVPVTVLASQSVDVILPGGAVVKLPTNDERTLRQILSAIMELGVGNND